MIAGGLKTRKSHQRALAGCQRGNPSHTRREPADKAFARTPGTCGHGLAFAVGGQQHSDQIGLTEWACTQEYRRFSPTLKLGFQTITLSNTVASQK